MRADNPGSMQYENWEEDGDKSCAMNAPRTSTCHQGLVPVLGVQVEAVHDVQNAVRFAALHNLHVVVKTSGHDFLGRSAAAGSFLIWMHKFKGITIHQSFEPEGGCAHYRGAAITVVGGIPWGEVYDALKPTGYILVGGMSLTVGATGGYVQGGGHGALSPTFGLAVDNVLQMEVVTADATLRVTNECQEADLFFALRGGGGGTFGVVTSVTYRLHPNPSNLVGAVLELNPPNGATWTTANQEEILTAWAQSTVALDAAHWAGYWSINPNLFSGFFLVPATETAARATFSPVVQALSQIQNVTTTLYSIHSYSTFQDWHSAIYNQIFPRTQTDYTGVRGVIGSRIIPLSALENPRSLAKTIVAAVELSEGSGVLGHMVAGPGVRMGDPLRQTAVTPAWRDGLWHLTTWSSWSWNATDVEKTAARIQARSIVELLQTAFPDAGAYVNEASVDELDWMRSFWGIKNYARLMVTKLRADPLGLFVCQHCVGSELWSEDGSCM